MPTSPVEAAIDRLYSLPIDQFVSARNELARQHRGEDGKTIRALAKPSVVAWGLNQVYWTARPVFDRLVAAAARLREAQASGLQGKGGDLRGAGAAHREALQAAIKEAAALLERAGHDSGPDALRALTAAYEALPWEEPAGRLVRPPAPSGFAIFAGMSLAEAPVREERQARKEHRAHEDQERERQELAARHRETIETARREAEAAAERARAADERLARAREDEHAARDRLEAARRAVKEAEAALREAERAAAAAQAGLRKASSPKP